MTWLYEAMSGSDELLVYEGLPHQLFERVAHESELKRVPTFMLDDQALYERPLDVNESDRRKLSEGLSSGRTWIPPRNATVPMKLCGGFHADYAITWVKKKQPLASILICFGCGELRFIGQGYSITTDMTKDGGKELAAILKEYQQERPPFRHRENVEKLQTLLPKMEPPRIDYKP